MRYRKKFLGLAILLLAWATVVFAEDYNLQYFLAKASSEKAELSKNESTELLNRINEVVEKSREIHTKLTHAIQTGEVEILYQDGRFWMSKLEEDQRSIEDGIQQIKLLRERPTHLMASTRLYKSLKDLSSNFNAYNNIPLFSGLVGDLGPEMELWVDPVFYKLYLLPLAKLKDVEKAPPAKVSPQKEKKPIPKTKKP